MAYRREGLVVAFILPLPPSVNKIYKRGYFGGVQLTEEARIFKAIVWAKLFGLGPVKPPVEVWIEMVVVNNRKRDIDNVLKLTLDALSDSLGFDDNDILSLHLEKRLEKGGEPRLECKVETIVTEGVR